MIAPRRRRPSSRAQAVGKVEIPVTDTAPRAAMMLPQSLREK